MNHVVTSNAMRTAFIVTVSISVICSVIGYVLTPETIAIHFNSSGMPDNYASSLTALIIWLGVTGLVFFTFYTAPGALRRMPASMINIPNNEFWFNHQNKANTLKKLENQLFAFGIATCIFLTSVSLLATVANVSEPITFNAKLFWTLFGLYVAYTVYWAITLYLSFKKPKSNGQASLE